MDYLFRSEAYHYCTVGEVERHIEEGKIFPEPSSLDRFGVNIVLCLAEDLRGDDWSPFRYAGSDLDAYPARIRLEEGHRLLPTLYLLAEGLNEVFHVSHEVIRCAMSWLNSLPRDALGRYVFTDDPIPMAAWHQVQWWDEENEEWKDWKRDGGTWAVDPL